MDFGQFNLKPLFHWVSLAPNISDWSRYVKDFCSVDGELRKLLTVKYSRLDRLSNVVFEVNHRAGRLAELSLVRRWFRAHVWPDELGRAFAEVAASGAEIEKDFDDQIWI